MSPFGDISTTLHSLKAFFSMHSWFLSLIISNQCIFIVLWKDVLPISTAIPWPARQNPISLPLFMQLHLLKTLFSLLQLLSFLFPLKFLSSFTNSLNLGDLFSRLDHLLQKPLNQVVLAPKVLHYLSPKTYCICFQIFLKSSLLVTRVSCAYFRKKIENKYK